MARAKGVSSLTRADRVGAVSALLDRDGGALASFESELRSHRDRAVEALAFELARRVQDEIAAVHWLVSPQRVTTLEACNVDIYGWDDGPLVHFSVREGRLSTWTQRDVSARQARLLRRSTPPEWVEFARENAILAARLAGATTTP